MTARQTEVIAAASLVVLAIVAGVVVTFKPISRRNLELTGVVLVQNSDPQKETPISGVAVTAEVDYLSVTTQSDSSGFFRLDLPARVDQRHPAVLSFRYHGYEPLEKLEPAADRICVARMTPTLEKIQAQTSSTTTEIADLRVRYSVKSTTTVDIASIAQRFEVPNTGNLPCNAGESCSPDRRWKATVLTASFDAGKGNEFSEQRASCIAGPCPFTTKSVDLDNAGRILRVTARNWSDTTTFLVEAEITRTQISDMIRYSYPVKFGEGLDFTLPATAEGPSIEADVNGAPIVFPLGPDAILSWAVCAVKTGADRSKLYRCDLKPGYRLR